MSDDNKIKPVKETITPAAFDLVVTQRIRVSGAEWDKMPVGDRFWMVFRWFKEYQILDPRKFRRQLLVVKPYWQARCDEQRVTTE